MPAQIETAIPLGRRIGEIMEEKGDAFSYRAFGERIGISKDILSRCINGERYIKPSELTKICQGLNISERRLRQEDTFEDSKELEQLLKSRANPKRALALAKKIAELAVGMTEKSWALNNHAFANFELQHYDDAHCIWLDAYEFARKVSERYGEKTVLSHIVSNLMLSFSVRKEYIMMGEIIKEAERYLSDMPSHLGAMSYSLAKLSEQLGDLEEAKKRIYQSHDHYVTDGNHIRIGIAKINVAHYEYRTKCYSKAKKFLEEAIDYLVTDRNTRWIALKEYSKVLIKMGQKSLATEVIKKTLDCEESKAMSTLLLSKFNLLLAISQNDIAYAQVVLETENVPEFIQYAACVLLMNHYTQLGDATSLMRYYEIAASLAVHKNDILDMEGF